MAYRVLILALLLILIDCTVVDTALQWRSRRPPPTFYVTTADMVVPLVSSSCFLWIRSNIMSRIKTTLIKTALAC